MSTALTVRFRFTKHGKVRFTSHRDVARLWERALRVAGATVTYSEGFSPRPRLSFGLALPTGAASDGEYVDVRLEEEPADGLEVLCARLAAALPEGMEVPAAAVLAPGAPSLQEVVDASEWSILLGGDLDPSPVGVAVAAALAADELPVRRERKGKEQVADLRPALLDLAVAPGPDGPELTAVLATRPTSFRPEELASALDPSWRVVRMRRLHQWILDGERRHEPVPLGAPSPRAEVRAS